MATYHYKSFELWDCWVEADSLEDAAEKLIEHGCDHGEAIEIISSDMTLEEDKCK